VLDFSTPFAWIWLASLILITSLVFKRHVLLFWLLVCPPIIALKMQVPFLVSDIYAVYSLKPTNFLRNFSAHALV